MLTIRTVHRYLSFNCPGRAAGSANTAAAKGSNVMLLNVVFTVSTTLAGGIPYTDTLFVGANPTYSNANNLVLTSDASTGVNIAKQFVAQVSTARSDTGVLPGHMACFESVDVSRKPCADGQHLWYSSFCSVTR